MKGKKFIAIVSIVCILAVILCIPAFATVTESNGDGYALYNGVKLPDISTLDVDLTSYPYFVIHKSTDTTDNIIRYFVTYSTAGFAYLDSMVSTGGACIRYSCSPNYSSWELVSGSISGNIDGNEVFWSSHNINDIRGGSVFLVASNPISLDDYNVIQWDGDTTGLTDVLGYFCVLAPYEYTDNAIAVWQSDKLYVETDFDTDSSKWSISSSGLAPDLGVGNLIVVASDGTYGNVQLNGIAATYESNGYVSLIAYRTVEEPPGEGGDEPDEPQPPFWAAEIYFKLHLLALILQLKLSCCAVNLPH